MKSVSTERIENVDSFARAWCAARGLRFGSELVEDLCQEAWVAALENDYDRAVIVKAMDVYRKKEYARPVPFTVIGHDEADISACNEYGLDEFGGFLPEDLGLHYDEYHGWCRDDV